MLTFMIHNKELERQILSALIQFPSSFADIAGLIDESGFFSVMAVLFIELYLR